MKNYFIVLLAVFLWGIHGPAGRFLALEGISMPFVTVVRFMIGCIFIFSWLIITGKFSALFFKFYKQIIPIAFIGIALNSILYHLGFNYISATAVMLLENLSPIFVLILAKLIDKEEISLLKVVSCIISIVGLVFIVFGKGGVDTNNNLYLIGIVLEVLAGITFGAYTWLSGRFLVRNSAYLQECNLSHTDIILNLLFHVFFIASILMSPLLFIPGKKPEAFSHWFWIFEMGIFQSGVAYILWNKAIYGLKTTYTSLFFFLTVFFTLINEMLFLNFKPNWQILLGIMFILGGTTFLMFAKVKAKLKQVISSSTG